MHSSLTVPKKRNRKWLIIGIVGTLVVLALVLEWPIRFALAVRKDATFGERVLLYRVDHVALAEELRKFATERRWRLSDERSEPDIVWPSDESLPASLRILQPTSLVVFEDRIKLECGGPLLHFGIVVFRSGNRGTGLRELGPGVWFYADDGRIPAE